MFPSVSDPYTLLYIVLNCPQPLPIVTGKWNIALLGWAFLVLPSW